MLVKLDPSRFNTFATAPPRFKSPAATHETHTLDAQKGPLGQHATLGRQCRTAGGAAERKPGPPARPKLGLTPRTLGSALTSRQREPQLDKRHQHHEGQLLCQRPHDGEHNTLAHTRAHAHTYAHTNFGVFGLAQDPGVRCDVTHAPPILRGTREHAHVHTGWFSYLCGVVWLASTLNYVS